jgi:hypothetical protein
VFAAHAAERHRPTVCAVCGQTLAVGAPAVPYTGFQSLDLHWDDPATPGLRPWVVDHQYLDLTCPCGHHTRARPLQGEVDPTLERVQLREWRLVEPGLATLIVALSLRFRLSRTRIQEFLHAWLGIQLSLYFNHCLGRSDVNLLELTQPLAPSIMLVRGNLRKIPAFPAARERAPYTVLPPSFHGFAAPVATKESRQRSGTTCSRTRRERYDLCGALGKGRSAQGSLGREQPVFRPVASRQRLPVQLVRRHRSPRQGS